MEEQPARGDTGGMPLTVLVVDDDAGFRRVARRLLTKRGLVVVADVDSGEAAIEAVRRHRPDGVLLDVNLPDRDGLWVIRALADRSDGPSIVLTSTDAFHDPGAVLAASGARAFVAKEKLVEADLLCLFSSAVT
jgi:CheY-like chemotaxis protein